MEVISRPSLEQLLEAKSRLSDVIPTKARRFAIFPREGYLAGYYPHATGRSQSGGGPNHAHSHQLAWLYAVADQDIPASYYRWKVLENGPDTFQLVIDIVDGIEVRQGLVN